MPEFTEYAPGTPCWVDVTSPELDRTISFYSELFGWEADADLAARGRRLHDVHEGGQAGRRGKPAAAGGDAVPLDDVPRERRRRRDRRQGRAKPEAPC